MMPRGQVEASKQGALSLACEWTVRQVQIHAGNMDVLNPRLARSAYVLGKTVKMQLTFDPDFDQT